MEVWRGTQEGLDAVILNPGIIIGQGPYHSGSGLLFKKVFKGIKRVPQGSTGLVSVKDVADAAIKAMQSTVKNERFILVAENWTYQKLINQISMSITKRPPTEPLKNWILSLAWRLDWLRGLYTKQRSLTRNASQSLQTKSSYDGSKAERILKISYSDLSAVINETGRHFLQHVK